MAKAKKGEGEVVNTLEEIKRRLEAKLGKGIIIDAINIKDFQVVSSGSIIIDKIIDCGGVPIGKLIEIFGPESGGKSTICLHIIKEFQDAGHVCLLGDFEHSFDANYARKIGVKVDELIITQPDTMEDGYRVIQEYVKSGLIGLAILDSHTSMVPKSRLEGEIGDSKMAPEARLNSEALKVIKPLLSPNGVTMIGVSQLRTDIGGMGDTNKPTGGNAWKFYSDIRIKIYKTMDKDKELNNTVITITKNKCGKPFGTGIVPITWGIGIDKELEVIQLGVELGIINKSGSWYSYEGSKIGQGASAVRSLLVDNPELFEEIAGKVKEKYIGDFVTPEDILKEEIADLVSDKILQDDI